MLCSQMDLINNFIMYAGNMEPGQWLPDGQPPLLSSSFHRNMKCKVRNRILLQFSAQYKNMSLSFHCVYSGCESKPTMPVLTQQTDRVCTACQSVLELALLLFSLWESETQTLRGGAKVRLPLFCDRRKVEIFFRLEEIVKDTEV